MDPGPQWSTMELWTHLCSGFKKSLTLCASVLTQSPPCRTFWSEKDTPPSPHALLLAWTSFLLKDYCKSCTTCSHAKPVCHKHYGLLKQLLIPKKPWNSISMDFIEKLPLSSSYTSILVIVDHLSKQSLFILTHDTIMSLQLMQLSILHVFSKHGVPSHVTSDCGTEFISHFFQSLGTTLDMMLHFTSRYHPEGDGQTEQTNQTLEQYL